MNRVELGCVLDFRLPFPEDLGRGLDPLLAAVRGGRRYSTLAFGTDSPVLPGLDPCLQSASLWLFQDRLWTSFAGEVARRDPRTGAVEATYAAPAPGEIAALHGEEGLKGERLEPWDLLSGSRMLFAVIGSDRDYQYRMLPVVFDPARSPSAWQPLRPASKSARLLKGMRGSLVLGASPDEYFMVQIDDAGAEAHIDQFIDMERRFRFDLAAGTYDYHPDALLSRVPCATVRPLNRGTWFVGGDGSLYWSIAPGGGGVVGRPYRKETFPIRAEEVVLPIPVAHPHELESPLFTGHGAGGALWTMDALGPEPVLRIRRWTVAGARAPAPPVGTARAPAPGAAPVDTREEFAARKQRLTRFAFLIGLANLGVILAFVQAFGFVPWMEILFKMVAVTGVAVLCVIAHRLLRCPACDYRIFGLAAPARCPNCRSPL